MLYQQSGECHGEPSIDNGGQKGKKMLERAWDAVLDAGVDGEYARRQVAWMKEYILFHGRRHPQEMGITEIRNARDGRRDDGRAQPAGRVGTVKVASGR